ncbi:hypothetical protein [Aquibacillus albus]|uniref:Chromosome segregation ATPase n=1 Tax=Aquibacillus albus TaxID=1168171 RepID=A0ABS2MX20_9BACI|nr:hypothetical protein [Aquibacillus albus]MBM7570448.1 chromosome segregation ATPase [Aquibacillus albus]
MSKNNGNSKLINWFKKTESESDRVIEEYEEQTEKEEKDDDTAIHLPNSHETTNFDALLQDRVSMDLMNSVEQILHNRQLIISKNTDLEEQVDHNMNYISNLKAETEQRDRKISNLERTIRDFENRLMNKQLNYDQLLEDYEDYQSNAKSQIESLKREISKEQDKYSKIQQQFHTYQEDSLQLKRDLEEKIRTLEVDNETLEQRFDATLKEKNKLLQLINDFTSRMTDTSYEQPAKTQSDAKVVPNMEES